MEARTTHILKNGLQFDALFPRAIFSETTVKKNAIVEDTVRFIPKVVYKTQWQVEKFVEQELKYLSFSEACKKLWHFVKDHIAYKKDDSGIEQVRSPRRLWWERVGDCDCYTTFISACLTALKIPKQILLRITKYKQNHFQHIYPVVITPNGNEIIMDCVVDAYNYEEPYSEKKDFTMELNYLDGVPEKSSRKNLDTEMAEDGAELGKLFDFLKKNKTGDATTTTPKKSGKVKAAINKGFNVINKINPATVILRAGILASMKLNIMKVAQRLKYAYLSDAEAKKRDVDQAKFERIKKIKDKIENIFYRAGGKKENLKEAILKGKGNANKEVPLSGFDSGYDIAVTGMNSKTPLTKVLGQEVYYSEFMEGTQQLNGLGQLGEPITAASITAASGVLAAIGAILKSIGSIFKKKEKGSTDFENTTDADLEAEQINTSIEKKDLDVLTTELEQESSNRSAESDSGDDSADETFWGKNKSWLKPTLIGVGSLATLGLGYYFLKPKPKKEKKEKPLSGLKSTKKSKEKKPEPTPPPPLVKKKKKSKKATTEKIKTIELK